MNPASFKIDSPSPALASQEVERYYDFLRPAFMVGGHDYQPEEFDEDLISGDVLLVRVWNEENLQALAAVRVRDLSGVRDLFVLGLVGSDAHQWADDFAEVVDKLADEAGCRSISLLGRPGIGKHVKAHGYKEAQIVFRKTLKGDNGDGR